MQETIRVYARLKPSAQKSIDLGFKFESVKSDGKAYQTNCKETTLTTRASSKVDLFDPNLDSKDPLPDLSNLLRITIPRQTLDGVCNISKKSLLFQFDEIFDSDTKQGHIFQTVAQPIVDRALDDYNGTT